MGSILRYSLKLAAVRSCFGRSVKEGEAGKGAIGI